MRIATEYVWIVLSVIMASMCLGLACQSHGDAFVGTPVATYNGKTLFAEEVALHVPEGASKRDSASFSKMYVNRWVQEQAVYEAAIAQDSALKQNLHFEAAAHARSLAGYHYANKLFDEKLDKDISPNEVANYYRQHQEKFVSTQVWCALFTIKTKGRLSYQKRQILEKGTKQEIAEMLADAKDVILSSKLDSSYVSQSDAQAALTGTSMQISQLRKGRVQDRSYTGGDNTYLTVKLFDQVAPGEVIPLSQVTPTIKEILLQKRRDALWTQTQAQLLQKAKSEQKINILDK